jgi:hypothetical protein
MVRLLSLRADLPAVVAVNVMSSMWEENDEEEWDFYAWSALHIAFNVWCREVIHQGVLSSESAAKRGVVDLFREASRTATFRDAFKLKGAELLGMDVLDLSPEMTSALPAPRMGMRPFSVTRLDKLPPPNLRFTSCRPPAMKVQLTVSDLADEYGEGMPIAWETTYEDLIEGRVRVKSGYGQYTQGIVEFADDDGAFATQVPDGMSVMYAPVVDEFDYVTLLETCIFETRESVEARIRSAVEAYARVAVLARITYDRECLGIPADLEPASVTVTQEGDGAKSVVQVAFSGKGEQMVRKANWWCNAIFGDRANQLALEAANRLAQSLKVPFLI